jgi:hypothetical protein
MMGKGGFKLQPLPPNPLSPTGGDGDQTHADCAETDLLPMKNGLDFVSVYKLLYSKNGNAYIWRRVYN